MKSVDSDGMIQNTKTIHLPPKPINDNGKLSTRTQNYV